GTTSRYILANVGSYDNNAAFRASGLQTEGAAALEAFFNWVDTTDPDMWLRLTTYNGIDYPNPALDTRGKVRFKIVNKGEITDGAIGLCIGIRETGVDVDQLADGGTGGPIEWVGVSTDLSVIEAGTNGIIESAVAGDDVLIDTNGVQAINWGLDRILQSVANPSSDDVAASGYVRSSATGGRVPIPAITIPVSVVPKLLEWNLDTGQVSVDGGTAVGGTAGFTGNGDLSDAPNDRGTFEHLAITNVVTDEAVSMDFAIDELQFEATVPDQPPPPTIRGPVYDTHTTVEVECDTGLPYNVTLAELFINGASQGTEAPVGNVATFGTVVPLELSPSDVLTATQTGNGVESPPSVPVVVYGEGTVLADDFEGYTDQADMETIWGQTLPAAGELFRPRLITGSASSCQNMVVNDYPENIEGSRLYRSIGEVNGTDPEPLWVTFRFKHDYNSTSARARFELTPATDPAVRTYGAIGFAFTNGVGDEWGEQYTSMTNSPSPVLTGYVSDYFNYDYALTGIEREPGVWHKMQMKIDSNYVNFYIDDQLANPVGTNGLPIATNGVPLYPNGVNRVNNEPFRHVVLSIGYWGGGPLEMYDDISVTIADTTIPFGDPHPVDSPTVVGPVFPAGTLVDLVDIDSNAAQVAVYANGVGPAIGTATGPFLDNTATVSVSPRVNGDVITATQTVEGTESCFSWPEVVGVPTVSVQALLVPGQDAVEVSDLEEGLAEAVTVYKVSGGEPLAQLGTVANPATDPVTVTVTPLVNGDEIAAAQTIGGVEGPLSAAVTVTVPAPTLPGGLSVEDTVVTVESVHPLATLVTVYVDGGEAGSVSPMGATTVDVPVPPLFVNEVVTATQTIGGVESPPSNAVLVSFPICLCILTDDFNTDNSADWNINATADTDATFAYDYSLVGVPASPNGEGGRLGLRMAANIVMPGTIDSITVSPKNILPMLASQGYRIEFDMWINTVWPETSSGSTEFISAGIGYDNVTINQADGGGLNDATSGDGAWFAISSDADALEDIRAYLDLAAQSPATGQFTAGTDANANNTNFSQFYIDLFGIPEVPAEQIALFPTQGGRPMMAGAPGMAWHRIAVTAIGDWARWEINDVVIANLDATNGPISLDGNVSFGFMDVFTSVSGRPQLSFGLVDNLRVLIGHTPGTNGDWDGDSDVDLADYEAFEDCMGGANVAPTPTSGPSCVSFCRSVFDFDDDNDVDLKDFAAFQEAF
ncbi:MAG: hypothetical protein JSV19_02655, partial [Phycisphaerales bacterium]